ncbi:MAG: response regulator transcription factor [Bacteroidales bacterium]|jgi:two-component system response regulator NreC|nr:response regulator transcription factor [Bacteroidales bacterium]
MSSIISITIIGSHQLYCEGVASLLAGNANMHVQALYSNFQDFEKHNEHSVIHVLIKVLHKVEASDIDDIGTMQKLFPKTKILIVSSLENERVIYKLIKSGAKGFLASDASQHDLLEAVYSLRGGYDYFSKSITDIVVNHYAHDEEHTAELEKLSVREKEIITLWGNSFSNKEIADKLFISVRTVESHKTHIMQKLNLKTAVDLMKYAIKNNIIQV